MRTAVSMCIPRAFITSFVCIHDIYLCIHAIGVPEGVTLLEFEGARQEEEHEVQAIDEAAAEEELPECPDHRPSSFLKGKPQSILSLPYFYKYLEYLLLLMMH